MPDDPRPSKSIQSFPRVLPDGQIEAFAQGWIGEAQVDRPVTAVTRSNNGSQVVFHSFDPATKTWTHRLVPIGSTLMFSPSMVDV